MAPVPPKRKVTPEDLDAQIKNLKTDIELLRAEIQTIKKNEAILGRTLVSLKQDVSSGGGKGSGGSARVDEDSIARVVKEQLANYATKADLAEIKYTLDMVNPFSFVTKDQVQEMISKGRGKAEDDGKKIRKTAMI